MIIFKIVFRPFMRTGRHPGNLALRIIYGLKLKTVSCYMRNLSVIYNCALESWRIVAAGVSPFADVFTGVEETRCRALTASYANTLKNVSIKLFFRLYRSGSAAYNSICNPYFSWCFFSAFMRKVCVLLILPTLRNPISMLAFFIIIVKSLVSRFVFLSMKVCSV